MSKRYPLERKEGRNEGWEENGRTVSWVGMRKLR